MKSIKITVDPSIPRLPFRELKPFQHDAKEISFENLEKLKSRILSVGFCAPVCVWNDRDNLHILDGHQRIVALAALEADGYAIPEIPAVQVNASSRTQAEEILLSMISQYGEINEDSTWLKDLLDTFDSSIRDTFLFRNGVVDFDIDLGLELDQPEEDPGEKPKNCCPECGHEW